MDHPARLRRLLSSLERPLLVTSLVNLRYLTGFGGTSAAMIATPDGATFMTDGRYAELAGDLVAALPATELVVQKGTLLETLARLVADLPELGVEADHVTWTFARALGDDYSGTMHPEAGVVETLRRVKDRDEVEALRKAAAAGDAAFARVGELAAASATEGELGHLLIEAMRAAGGEPAGWPPIVAAGAHASRPHHRSGAGPVEAGLLLLDYGCVVDGYHSDMTRSVWLGGGSDEEVERIHGAVLESNEAGIAAVAPGVRAHDVDEACRRVLRDHGYEELFVHSTGHGVGLEIHEAPSVKKDSADVLEPGLVVTVEPGVYVPGRGGVRIEDMVLVTETGNEVLTRSPKAMRP